MTPTTFQKPELRDSLDNIIQAGAYGKKTAFCNAQNTGVLDYINNNLMWLWANFIDEPTIGAMIDSKISTAKEDIAKSVWDLRECTHIPAGADLNNYKVSGAYTCESSVIAASIVNTPDNFYPGNFKLIVDCNLNTTNVPFGFQLIFSNLTAVIYYRNFTHGGNYGEWRRLTSTDDLSNYLRLTGGVLSLAGLDDFIIKRLSTGGSPFISFYQNDTVLGRLGISYIDKVPLFLTSEGVSYKMSYITDANYSGSNDRWYRKWIDGFIEQGGIKPSGGAKNITYLTPFKTKNLSINLTPFFEADGWSFSTYVISKSLTGFTLSQKSASDSSWGASSVPVIWYATGY